MSSKYTVIYDTDTKRIQDEFATPGAAKTSLTAARKRDVKRNSTRTKNWAVISLDEYNRTIRCTKKVKNLLSGVEIEIDINTPACCDPSTETYWSC